MTDLANYIEVVETAYETMLAYAAQGRDTDRSEDNPESSTPSEIRIILTGLRQALQHIQENLSGSDFRFAEVVVDDIRKVDAALELVLAQSDLGSEIVDNLNASIHLRAVITDLFLVDETQT